ncbi:hypothetical protein QVD17_39408 [Tagetes erecta]|uniref:Uncharacterized protein n=1 Tax=Tagetes erecta TaxID=13708 RepID=A0AAD8JQC3_TARER|nr:hypothetical protein QVD17_39408 [Tagetes erecta]
MSVTLHYVVCPQTILEWSPSTCPTTSFLWTHMSSNLILSPTFFHSLPPPNFHLFSRRRSLSHPQRL